MITATLDTTKLVVLMLAGAAFAAAGLWLMLRPKPETGAAKIELFGLKFEAASAGLLVFLTGAGFIAVPVFVPERESVPAPRASSDAPQVGVSGQPATGAGPAEKKDGRVAPVPIPTDIIPARARATAREVEPNNDYESANLIAAGRSVAGEVQNRNEDWFAVPVNANETTLNVRLRSLQGSACYIHFYSAAETALRDKGDFPEEHTVSDWTLPLDGAGAVLLRIWGYEDCRYELFTSHAES